MDFSPQCCLFFVSVTLTGLVRISKTWYRWKDLSLKLLLFINLYLVTRGPTIFPDKSERLNEHCVVRQNWNNTRASNESSFETRKRSVKLWETSIFYIHHLKGFQETIYFSRKKTITIRTYIERTYQQHLRLQFKWN